MIVNVTPIAPTHTGNWLRCPVYARLRRDGWESRGVWTPNRLVGIAIHAGLTAHYRTGAEGAVEAVEALTAGFREQSAWTLPALSKLVLTGLKRAVHDGLRGQGEVLSVDEPLPSRARPDLVQRIPGQGIVVTDTKVSMSAGFERITEYDTSHQLWHYAWEVGDTLGEPVSWVRVHQVTLTPRPATLLHPIRVTAARLAFWLRGAHDAWARMALEGDPAPNWTACVTRYGRCEYTEFCHVLNGDVDAAEAVYERVPRESHV